MQEIIPQRILTHDTEGRKPPNMKESALKSFCTHYRMDYPAYIVVIGHSLHFFEANLLCLFIVQHFGIILAYRVSVGLRHTNLTVK